MGRLFIVLLVLASFGLNYLMFTGNIPAVISNLYSSPADETIPSETTCDITAHETLLSTYDKAIESENWPVASEAATQLTDLAQCSPAASAVDIARLGLKFGEDFHGADQWALAVPHFKMAFEALEYLRADSDDFTLLFNPEDAAESALAYASATIYTNEALADKTTDALNEGSAAISTAASYIDTIKSLAGFGFGDVYGKQLNDLIILHGKTVMAGFAQPLGDDDYKAKQARKEAVETALNLSDRFTGQGKAELKPAYLVQAHRDLHKLIDNPDTEWDRTTLASMDRDLTVRLLTAREISPRSTDAATVRQRKLALSEARHAIKLIEAAPYIARRDDPIWTEDLNPYALAARYQWDLGDRNGARKTAIQGMRFAVTEKLPPEKSGATLYVYMRIAEAQKQRQVGLLSNTDAFPDTSDLGSYVRELQNSVCTGEQRQSSEIDCKAHVEALIIIIIAHDFFGAIEFETAEAQAMMTESLPKDIRVEILFGTSREYKPGKKKDEKKFAMKKDPDAKGWRGEVTLVAPYSKLGPPLLAGVFEDKKDRANYFKFTLLDVFGAGAAAEAKFREELAKNLADAGTNDALIYVHGVGNSFADAAKRSAQLSYDLSFQGATLFYSWPTQNNFLFYNRDVRMAKEEAVIEDYMKFLEETIAGAERVNIVAHSHGAQLTVTGLGRLKKKFENEGRELKLGQIILAAPDVDAKDLDFAVKDNLAPIAEHVTVYTSKYDGALWLSSVLRFFKTRGGLGKDNKACEADLVDASGVVPVGAHGYFAREAMVVADLRSLFWHELKPETRCFLEDSGKKKGSKWKFSKERCDVTAFDIASVIAERGVTDTESDAFLEAYQSLDPRTILTAAEAVDREWVSEAEATETHYVRTMGLETSRIGPLRTDARFIETKAALGVITARLSRTNANQCAAG